MQELSDPSLIIDGRYVEAGVMYSFPRRRTTRFRLHVAIRCQTSLRCLILLVDVGLLLAICSLAYEYLVVFAGESH
jgi:hypothetical protein